MSFDVQLPDAMGTVSATDGAAGEMSSALAAVGNAMHSMQSSLNYSGAVVDALAAVQVGAIAPATATLMSKVNTATSCTSEALGAYAEGDQTMASIVPTLPNNPAMPGVS